MGPRSPIGLPAPPGPMPPPPLPAACRYLQEGGAGAARAPKAVQDAYASYRSRQDDASLEALVQLVERGDGGSAACMALAKARCYCCRCHCRPLCAWHVVGAPVFLGASSGLCLPAWQPFMLGMLPGGCDATLLPPAGRQASMLHAALRAGEGEAGEAEAARLLQQAVEAATHGVLRYKSAQLLVRCKQGGPLLPLGA